MKENITLLKERYKGFYIDRPLGNNAFSFDQRRQRRIYVPPLVEGDLADLAVSDKIHFCEIDEDGREQMLPGLARQVYWRNGSKHIFMFDNHNHAFCYWMAAHHAGLIEPGTLLVHVDQHSDMRVPETGFIPDPEGKIDLHAVFEYTNFTLNVGNFIQPALQTGLFGRIEVIDSSTAFEKHFPRPLVLDIDIDIFSSEMGYISDDLKLARIREYFDQARVITIATSPYFIDQEKAIQKIMQMF